MNRIAQFWHRCSSVLFLALVINKHCAYYIWKIHFIIVDFQLLLSTINTTQICHWRYETGIMDIGIYFHISWPHKMYFTLLWLTSFASLFSELHSAILCVCVRKSRSAAGCFWYFHFVRCRCRCRCASFIYTWPRSMIQNSHSDSCCTHSDEHSTNQPTDTRNVLHFAHSQIRLDRRVRDSSEYLFKYTIHHKRLLKARHLNLHELGWKFLSDPDSGFIIQLFYMRSFVHLFVCLLSRAAKWWCSL